MTHSQCIPLPNLEATSNFAAVLAPALRPGDVVALYGELGTGKTAFARALIAHLAGRPIEVPSPTYTLVQTYDLPSLGVFHFDLYRIGAPKDLDELGWDDTDAGLCLVEWPERAGPRLPQWRLDIILKIVGTGREAHLEPHGEDWQNRLHGLRF